MYSELDPVFFFFLDIYLFPAIATGKYFYDLILHTRELRQAKVKLSVLSHLDAT